MEEQLSMLEETRAEKILKRGMNSYSVDVTAFSCDFYEYEQEYATPNQLNRFQGEYMKQYSWAEMTLARLYWKESNKKSNRN